MFNYSFKENAFFKWYILQVYQHITKYNKIIQLFVESSLKHFDLEY